MAVFRYLFFFSLYAQWLWLLKIWYSDIIWYWMIAIIVSDFKVYQSIFKTIIIIKITIRLRNEFENAHCCCELQDNPVFWLFKSDFFLNTNVIYYIFSVKKNMQDVTERNHAILIISKNNIASYFFVNFR